jgi:hypothetical protein
MLRDRLWWWYGEQVAKLSAQAGRLFVKKSLTHVVVKYFACSAKVSCNNQSDIIFRRTKKVQSWRTGLHEWYLVKVRVSRLKATL